MKYNILQGDCRELMATLDENSVDAIVTDPPYELGFMGKIWDASGVAFDVNTWKEALRVLKPGGHLIAFSGSRTYHRMAVAIEDAGFEIRDQIMWVYGSGFPKSHNISKGIDKAAGAVPIETGLPNNLNSCLGGSACHCETDGTKFSATKHAAKTIAATVAAQQWDGWGTALKPAHEPMVLARKPLIGTVANNVLTYGTGGLNIDGSRVGTTVETWPASRSFASGISSGFTEGLEKGETQATGEAPAGRWPANFIHDGSDEVVALFPDTKGKIGMAQNGSGSQIGPTGLKKNANSFVSDGISDSGSAARFFYCAKASKRDRNEGTLNNHPTVKPTLLMQYLVRLVTPPKGIVLDPFMGSGSTGKACAYEGFDFIGMELTAEYIPIATARIEFALANKDEQLDL